jgi:hypothetical protein
MAALQRSPRPDGGFIVRQDLNRTSFKQSLIAIAFAGIYLDALLHVEGPRSLGKTRYKKLRGKYGRNPIYEEKLAACGITDTETLEECRAFRESRNNLNHKKAIEPAELSKTSIRFAQ